MRQAEPGSDETVRILPRPPLKSGGAARWIALAAAAVLLVCGSAAWWFWPRPVPPRVTQSSAPVSAPEFRIVTATEQQILDDVPASLTVFRFAGNPQILVLDIASLHEQGEMLNRVAALMEKAGLPRDRVLTDAELGAAIRERGDTVETFYYGHDYPAAALVRFFALADTQRIELDPQEERLRALLRQLGWLTPDISAALISLPAVGADRYVTQASRAAILRHELSHGEFFSNPAYAGYVRDFWRTRLTDAERAGVRRFLGAEEYDTRAEELMYNEMQAYLMFTRDPMFFTPDKAGLAPGRLAELRAEFLAGMPPGWLRDVMASYERPTASQ